MQTLPPSFNLTFFVPFVARFPLPPSPPTTKTTATGEIHYLRGFAEANEKIHQTPILIYLF